MLACIPPPHPFARVTTGITGGSGPIFPVSHQCEGWEIGFGLGLHKDEKITPFIILITTQTLCCPPPTNIPFEVIHYPN